MVVMFANNHNKEIKVNNTALNNNSSVATSNGTNTELQTTDTETQTETSNPTQNSNDNNNHNNNNNRHEESHVETAQSGYQESVLEDDDDYDDSEIYVDDRGRVSVGHWDDEGYWNAEYVV